MSSDLGKESVPQAKRTAASYLRVEFGYGRVSEIAATYRAVAVSCIQQQITRVMVVVGDPEPAGERALRAAATMMVVAGIASDFRLALVAAAPQVMQAYRNTQRDLSAAGVTTRLFEREEDAARWLGVGDGVSRRAP
jgi:hypothetical protein